MKIILVGHQGSQKIVPASQYLVEKYLPGFEIHWLNYTGVLNEWSKYIAEYLSSLQDEFIIFALDDYLLSAPMQGNIYYDGLRLLENPEITCVKLCRNTPEEHEQYPVTTQYTIWRRKELVDLLLKTTTPWDFEMNGSKLFTAAGKQSVYSTNPALEYPVHSCLSSRWKGIRIDGCNPDDIEELINKGLLNKDELYR